MTAQPREGEKEQDLTLEKKETILASPNDDYYYEFTELAKDDHLKGEIVSTEHIDARATFLALDVI